MKIISKFSDYYDGVAKKFYDKDTLFVREQNIFRINAPRTNIYESSAFAYLPKEFRNCICFCGKYYYFFEYIDRNGKRLIDYTYNPSKKSKYDPWLTPATEFINEINKEGKTLIEKYGPIFLLCGSDTRAYECCENDNGEITYDPVFKNRSGYNHYIYIVTNPRLQNFGFMNMLDTYQAYQKLYQYVCNQARPEKPIPQFSNEDKISATGFNLKTSFRKVKNTNQL